MKRSVFHVALGLAALFAAHTVQATQSVYAASDVSGTVFPSNQVTIGAGQQLTFYGRYTSDNPNESGLGLKVQYDAAKITNVIVDQVVTKCMVFIPDVPISGGQVLFGWADTSQRVGGAVGWPGTADPVVGPSTAPCISPPGIATTTAALSVPSTLFRFKATTAPGFTSGTTNINFVSSSASSAGGSSSFTPTSLTVVGGPAPALSLVSASSRKTHGAAGDFDILIDPLGSLTIGTTITVEPRAIGTGYKIVFLFNGLVSSAGVTTTAGTTGVASFAGNEVTVTLTGVTNKTRVQVDLSNVNGLGVSATAIVGFLLGDVTGTSRLVNSTDIATVKANSSAALVTSSNFKSDTNASGQTNATDIATVKASSSPSGIP